VRRAGVKPQLILKEPPTVNTTNPKQNNIAKAILRTADNAVFPWTHRMAAREGTVTIWYDYHQRKIISQAPEDVVKGTQFGEENGLIVMPRKPEASATRESLARSPVDIAIMQQELAQNTDPAQFLPVDIVKPTVDPTQTMVSNPIIDLNSLST
jgi:hypothetical protein